MKNIFRRTKEQPPLMEAARLSDEERLVNAELLTFAAARIIWPATPEDTAAPDELKDFYRALDERTKTILERRQYDSGRLNADKTLGVGLPLRAAHLVYKLGLVQGNWEVGYFRHVARPASENEYHDWLTYSLLDKRQLPEPRPADDSDKANLYITNEDVELAPDVRGRWMEDVLSRQRPKYGFRAPLISIIELPGMTVSGLDGANANMLSWRDTDDPLYRRPSTVFELPSTRHALQQTGLEQATSLDWLIEQSRKH